MIWDHFGVERQDEDLEVVGGILTGCVFVGLFMGISQLVFRIVRFFRD